MLLKLLNPETRYSTNVDGTLPQQTNVTPQNYGTLPNKKKHVPPQNCGTLTNKTHVPPTNYGTLPKQQMFHQKTVELFPKNKCSTKKRWNSTNAIWNSTGTVRPPTEPVEFHMMFHVFGHLGGNNGPCSIPQTNKSGLHPCVPS